MLECGRLAQRVGDASPVAFFVIRVRRLACQRILDFDQLVVGVMDAFLHMAVAVGNRRREQTCDFAVSKGCGVARQTVGLLRHSTFGVIGVGETFFASQRTCDDPVVLVVRVFRLLPRRVGERDQASGCIVGEARRAIRLIADGSYQTRSVVRKQQFRTRCRFGHGRQFAVRAVLQGQLDAA